MIEEKFDGRQIMHDSVKMDELLGEENKLKSLFENPENKRVSLHKTGDEVKMNDGTIYVVQGNGEWRRKK